MPAGFCPPLKCQSGIMANSTMHQPKAMPTHMRSAGCARFHQMPFGDSIPVWVSMAIPSGQGCALEARDLPEPPAGEDDDHDDDPEDHQQGPVVKEPLAEWNGLGRLGNGILVSGHRRLQVDAGTVPSGGWSPRRRARRGDIS